MEHDYLQVLNCLGDTAVLIRNNSIAWVSDEARHLGIVPQLPLDELLPSCVAVKDFPGLQQFSLPVPWEKYYARVCPVDDGWVLAICTDLPRLSHGALAQTSRMIREPLDEVMAVSDTLFAKLEELENEQIQSQTARINRGFYRLLRAGSSLTDLERSISAPPLVLERVELRGWLREASVSACSVVATTGKTLEVEYPSTRLFADIYVELLDQALLCLLSNALRYSPEGAQIRLRLRRLGGQCVFTMENPISEPVSLTHLSGGFTNPIGGAGGTHGLGLGLLRVQSAAKQHGGALLLECTAEGKFCANLHIPERHDAEEVHIPLPQIVEGGYSRVLVELSEVLPDSVFDSRSI